MIRVWKETCVNRQKRRKSRNPTKEGKGNTLTDTNERRAAHVIANECPPALRSFQAPSSNRLRCATALPTLPAPHKHTHTHPLKEEKGTFRPRERPQRRGRWLVGLVGPWTHGKTSALRNGCWGGLALWSTAVWAPAATWLGAVVVAGRQGGKPC